jgi:hypothetical protein
LKAAALGSLHAGDANTGEQPSMARLPIGVHALPSIIARYAFGGIAQAQ